MEYSEKLTCGHCGNISKMEIVGSVSDMKKHDISDEDLQRYGPPPDEGYVYSILKCPACAKVNVTAYHWHDSMEEEEDLQISYHVLFPQSKKNPLGLPENIKAAYEAAEKVKTIDVNAYAILMRRLLEMVCLDKNAKKGTLAAMLKDLAEKNDIPDKLVKVAQGLKNLGNLGAHAGMGELSKEEIPILNLLCTAILEYIYSAPHLASLAEDKLKELKK